MDGDATWLGLAVILGVRVTLLEPDELGDCVWLGDTVGLELCVCEGDRVGLADID